MTAKNNRDGTDRLGSYAIWNDIFTRLFSIGPDGFNEVLARCHEVIAALAGGAHSAASAGEFTEHPVSEPDWELVDPHFRETLFQRYAAMRQQVEGSTDTQLQKNCVALVYSEIGGVCSAYGKPDEAMAAYERCVSFANASQDHMTAANAENHIGMILVDAGELQKAIEFFSDALAKRVKIRDFPGVASSLNNLGLAMDANRQPECAIKFYHLAVSLQRKLGDYQELATTLNNLGYAYADLHRHADAIDCLERAVLLLEERGDPRKLSATLRSLAEVWSLVGEHVKARRSYQQALTLAKENSDDVDRARTHRQFGRFLLRLGKLDESLEELKVALLLSEQGDDTGALSEVLLNLGEVSARLGDSAEADRYYQRYVATKERLGDVEGVQCVKARRSKDDWEDQHEMRHPLDCPQFHFSAIINLNEMLAIVAECPERPAPNDGPLLKKLLAEIAPLETKLDDLRRQERKDNRRTNE